MLANTGIPAMTKPAVQNDLGVLGGLQFTAACFAGPDKEWSLGPLQVPEDVAKHPALVRKLRHALHLLKADRAYAPTPTDFNGEIIEPTALNRTLKLGGGVIVLRNNQVPADGTFLRSAGDAGIFSAGGCGVIVAALDEHLIFAHAGRDCLIDRMRVLGETPRRHESVVDSIVAALLEFGYERHDLRRLHAWMLYSIKPGDFLHRDDNRDHTVYNRRVGMDVLGRLKAGAILTTEGPELDLPAVAKAQFVGHGVPGENIHLEHQYLNDELPHTRRGGGRYLVAIVRR